MSPVTVTLRCDFCYEAANFTDWEDSEERLADIIDREEWRTVDGNDCCPSCAEERGLLNG